MKKGFTLIELLIAVGLFSILVGIASAGFVNALHTEREVASVISAQTNAGLALEQMTREVRTGYLFCHAAGAATPSPSCGCTSSLGLNPVWTCSALDFYNAQTEHVHYSLVNGTLERSDSNQNGGVDEGITGNSTDVQSLTFTLQGQIEDDQWNPRITLVMSASPSSSDPILGSDLLRLETTVSARQIDCNAAGC